MVVGPGSEDPRVTKHEARSLRDPLGGLDESVCKHVCVLVCVCVCVCVRVCVCVCVVQAVK